MNAAKTIKLAFILGALACLALSGYFVAQIIWTSVTAERSIDVPSIQAQQATQTTSIAMQALEVAQSDLFGAYQRASATPTPQPTPTPPPPRTPLTFELTGVLAKAGGMGTATIARNTGARGELFKIGDQVYGQATLVKVFPDRVVLNRQGSEEILAFDDEQLIGLGTGLSRVEPDNTMASVSVGQAPVYRVNEPSRTSGLNNRSTPERSANPISSNRGPSQDSIPPGAPDTVDQARQMAQGIISSAQQDPYALLARYGLRPVERGYLVTGSARLLMAAQLRPGDIIIAVDGVPVGDPATDAQRIRAVLSKTSIRLSYLRNGENKTFQYRIPSLF